MNSAVHKAIIQIQHQSKFTNYAQIKNNVHLM